MRVAVFSESRIDEAAVRVLLEAMHEGYIEHFADGRFAARGYNQFVATIESVFKHLYYQTDVDALVLVCDSDGTDLHGIDHAGNEAGNPGCRHCQLTSIVRSSQQHLRERPVPKTLNVTIAVAPPSIEAWYSCGGANPDCTEAGWVVRKQGGASAPGEIRSLKQKLYGSGIRSTEVQRRIAIEQAERVASRIDQLAQLYPNSLGLLMQQVRDWSTDNT